MQSFKFIIISVSTAFKQAIDNNNSFSRELIWLASHGFLHLLGWDHLTSKALNKMLEYQEKLLLETPFSSINLSTGK